MKWIPYLPSTYLLSPITSIIITKLPICPKIWINLLLWKISLLLTNLLRTKKSEMKNKRQFGLRHMFPFFGRRKFVKTAIWIHFWTYQRKFRQINLQQKIVFTKYLVNNWIVNWGVDLLQALSFDFTKKNRKKFKWAIALT